MQPRIFNWDRYFVPIRILFRGNTQSCMYLYSEWYYSENARVCAKWHWNARDCVTGLLDRRSRECNPVTPVESVSLSFRTHTHVRSRFYHIHNVYKRNWPLSNEFNTKQLLVVTYFSIGNLFHCFADSWWNMPFKGTRHGNDVADGAVAKRLLLWQHASALWRHAVWIRIVTSHNAWMGYEYSLQNMNRARAIHKHDPHPLETMGRVW